MLQSFGCGLAACLQRFQSEVLDRSPLQPVLVSQESETG